MKHHLIAAAAIVLALPAHAGFYQDRYCTTISDRDRVNSKGVQLTSVAQIIQNERANYHLNRHRDPGDQGDETFHSRENRAALANIIQPNSAGPLLTGELIHGRGAMGICVLLEGSDFPSPDLQMEIWRNE